MKFSRTLLAVIAATTLAACGNLSNVDANGQTDNPVWPKISQDTFNHDGSQFGSWPNWANVRMIERGMNKSQIRQLIGNPQFAEGLYGVREWDYAFNYRENGIHKICQYKVLFDSKMNAQSFYWHPNGCYGNGTFRLSADFLFDFDKYNLTPNGKKVVADIAKELKAMKAQKVIVEGYTDRLGSVAYNLRLSQQRADRVKSWLIHDGVKAEFKTIGYGKANQVKACDNGLTGKALKECLAPNRRVIIRAFGQAVQSSDVYKMNSGVKGPAPMYK